MSKSLAIRAARILQALKDKNRDSLEISELAALDLAIESLAPEDELLPAGEYDHETGAVWHVWRTDATDARMEVNRLWQELREVAAALGNVGCPTPQMDALRNDLTARLRAAADDVHALVAHPSTARRASAPALEPGDRSVLGELHDQLLDWAQGSHAAGSKAEHLRRAAALKRVLALAHAAPPEADRTAGEAVAWRWVGTDGCYSQWMDRAVSEGYAPEASRIEYAYAHPPAAAAPPRRDENVEAVRAKLRERSAVGLAKYGTTTERDDLSHFDWLRHLQEELMDACVYLEAAMREEPK